MATVLSRNRRTVVAVLAVAAVVPLTAWVMAWPVERAVYLAPILVAAAGVVAGLGVVLGRAFAASVRSARHPWFVIGSLAAVLLVGVVLTLLGIKLPKE